MPLLTQGLKGLEKESLRMTADGHIAQTPHPQALGSALLHPHITTDYSEALIELITDAHTDARATLQQLETIHAFVQRHLAPGERLLGSSMPCLIRSEEDIPIAHYGSSNVGRMKTIYRQGLAWRYGRAMQAIAGIHYNYSIAEPLWPALQQLAGDTGSLQDFINARYFAMVRNSLRYGWLISWLFGHSPALSRSFFTRPGADLSRFQALGADTLFRPWATSLRMSDIGYRNDSQSALDISVNHLDDYVRDLSQAIQTPWPAYESIGIHPEEGYRQLNTHILQIENEYYSSIRPKQVAHSGEKPTLALKNRGVRYLELRCVDLNLFEPCGISLAQLDFLEIFMLLTLLDDSPTLDQQAKHQASDNALSTACCGRAPDARLQRGADSVPLRAWASELLDSMALIAASLDEALGAARYLPCITDQQLLLEHPEQLPSARMLAAMQSAPGGYLEVGSTWAARHAAHHQHASIPESALKALHQSSSASLQAQQQLEASDSMDLASYLARYFAQT